MRCSRAVRKRRRKKDKWENKKFWNGRRRKRSLLLLLLLHRFQFSHATAVTKKSPLATNSVHSRERDFLQSAH